MIDEKKLIEAFRASMDTGRESFPIDLIIECIEEQPKVGEWIPVSERLPNKEELDRYGAEFIVMIKGANKPTTLYLTRSGKWVDEGYEVYDVIAWQPLSKPYCSEK